MSGLIHPGRMPAAANIDAGIVECCMLRRRETGERSSLAIVVGDVEPIGTMYSSEMRTPRLDETGDVDDDDGDDASAAAFNARCANDSERADFAATIVGGGDDVRMFCTLPVELFMLFGTNAAAGGATTTLAAPPAPVAAVTTTALMAVGATRSDGDLLRSVELDPVPDSPSTMPST